MEMINYLFLEPLTYPFMQRALISSMIVAATCSIFSCFLILKGWSLVGDALSHAILPGIILAYLVNLPLLIGALISAFFCTIISHYLQQNTRLKSDTILGVVFSTMFAFGLVLLSKIKSDLHLLHILFGDILGISWPELSRMSVIALPAFLIMFIKRHDFMLYCFDQEQAKLVHIPTKLINLILLTLLVVTIVVALEAAGIILVIAMLIAPGATGLVLTKSYVKMIWVAFFSAQISVMMGVFLSYHGDLPTGPLIVIMQAILFVLAMFLSRYRIF